MNVTNMNITILWSWKFKTQRRCLDKYRHLGPKLLNIIIIVSLQNRSRERHIHKQTTLNLHLSSLQKNAAHIEVAPSNHRARGLYFLAIISESCLQILV